MPRRGPAWAWELQAHLDEAVGFLVGLVGLVLLAGVVWWGAALSFPWLCSWWGVSQAAQARMVGLLFAGVFLGGVGMGYGLATLD